MSFSDRLYHLLVSLAGIGIVAIGLLIGWLTHSGKGAGVFVALGFAVFVYGFPSEAQRKGYRD